MGESVTGVMPGGPGMDAGIPGCALRPRLCSLAPAMLPAGIRQGTAGAEIPPERYTGDANHPFPALLGGKSWRGQPSALPRRLVLLDGNSLP